ncbi:MAG: hypothetical protein U9N40_03785 [Euryarchaeota archaeon]|nr:hypothetical protein [Euryarchaeota archaeon]
MKVAIATLIKNAPDTTGVIHVFIKIAPDASCHAIHSSYATGNPFIREKPITS